MTVDWSARLREQSRFAKRMASDVPAALSDPYLEQEEVHQLFQTVENCALSFAAMIEELSRTEADERHMRAAAVISAVWLDLSRLAADRLRAVQPRQTRRGLR